MPSPAAEPRGHVEDPRSHRRILSFLAISIAVHLVLLLLGLPSAHRDVVPRLPEALEVAIIEHRPRPMVRPRPEAERPLPTELRRGTGGRRHRGASRSEAPRTPAEAPPTEVPAREAPNPDPAPPPEELPLIATPAQAALRYLLVADAGQMVQGRVSEMFDCAGASFGNRSCAGLAASAGAGGGGWGHGDGGSLGRSGALRLAFDPYCAPQPRITAEGVPCRGCED